MAKTDKDGKRNINDRDAEKVVGKSERRAAEGVWERKGASGAAGGRKRKTGRIAVVKKSYIWPELDCCGVELKSRVKSRVE